MPHRLRRDFAFWITAVLIVVAANFVVTRLRGSVMTPRQISVDGVVLLVGGILTLIGIALVLMRRLSGPSIVWSVGEISTGVGLALGLIIPPLALLAALGPGTRSIQMQREFLIASPPPAPENKMGTLVMFRNGVSAISATEVFRLKMQLEVLAHCAQRDIRVVGYASSAPYPTENEERNLRLANLRAEAVSKALATANVKASALPWQVYSEMVRNRRIRDTESGGARLKSAEALNRRVEILWVQAPGCPVE